MLKIPQSRSFGLPKFRGTPNRGIFSLIDESFPTDNSNLVTMRREIDDQVNRVIRRNLAIKVYTNMRIYDLFERFGESVIDRFSDINESKYAQWFQNEYELFFDKQFYDKTRRCNSRLIIDKGRYGIVDDIEIDRRESVSQFLQEISGKPQDLLPSQMQRYYRKRKTWMKRTNQLPGK